MQGSYSGFNLLYMWSTSKGGWGKIFEFEFCTNFFFLKKQQLFISVPAENYMLGLNPFSLDVWDGYKILGWGGAWKSTKESMLLKLFWNKGVYVAKFILKPKEVIITCNILGPYLKNSVRYRDLKKLSFGDFVLPWLTEIAITRSIFEIQGSYFGFIHLFMCSINHV